MFPEYPTLDINFEMADLKTTPVLTANCYHFWCRSYSLLGKSPSPVTQYLSFRGEEGCFLLEGQGQKNDETVWPVCAQATDVLRYQLVFYNTRGSCCGTMDIKVRNGTAGTPNGTLKITDVKALFMVMLWFREEWCENAKRISILK